LIILSMAGWFFLLWRKRSLLKQAQSSKVPDFAKLLQQLQNQPALLGKDMPEFQATINPHESDFHIDKDTIYNANNEDNSLRLKESIRTKLPKSKLPAIEPNYFSQMAKQTQHESMEQKILHYAEMGFSVEEIAYRTQIGKGEVKLVLNLHGQSVPMSAPEIRIQME